ncbi:unnamed protein product [Musa acuminata subsp. malaccensis]|uniref:(wild Malaysian banana) hypothetical protein n=1 Tax=Musa acuminata subsp. malaccensis TaxID=214687 RepID=A0A804J336_MUSAM|nr:unnamed protein product [Musa acuminata subsp. malaccensis]
MEPPTSQVMSSRDDPQDQIINAGCSCCYDCLTSCFDYICCYCLWDC